MLFTANDAYLRDFELIVPPTCVVSASKTENDAALAQMHDLVKADTTLSIRIELKMPTRRPSKKPDIEN